LLQKVIEIAKQSNMAVFCDEVFTPLFHTDEDPPPPLVSLGYRNSISTGSLSKAYGLPGVRVGWVISENAALLRKILIARDYTTISVSQLDDSVAAYALDSDVRPSLLKRNLALCRESIAVLDDFVRRNDRCRWTKPRGGGTGFIQIMDKNGEPVDDYEFGVQVAQKKGLLVVPCGFCFRDDGTDDFRFALGDPDVLRQGLPLLEEFLNE
jgi:aspartate/methionine/tyrosine aminotransferase